MASIHREIRIEAPPALVWDALRDVGAIHTRLAPGFVTDVRLEGGARVVTFGSGLVVRELLIDVDEERRRVAWSAVGTAMTHHNASAQVFPDGDGTRLVWIADLLPGAVAPAIARMIEQGLGAMRDHLGAVAATAAA
jgi:carbon monoxide dehydrogenase subunit G